MQRREFVTSATATIAAASLAGCSGILGGDGGGSSGPDGAVEGYLKASKNGNTEEMRGYLHPDRALNGTVEATGNGEASIDSIETVEEGEEQATVTATVSQDGESITYEFDVRKNEGEWKIYDYTLQN